MEIECGHVSLYSIRRMASFFLIIQLCLLHIPYPVIRIIPVSIVHSSFSFFSPTTSNSVLYSLYYFVSFVTMHLTHHLFHISRISFRINSLRSSISHIRKLYLDIEKFAHLKMVDNFITRFIVSSTELFTAIELVGMLGINRKTTHSQSDCSKSEQYLPFPCSEITVVRSEGIRYLECELRGESHVDVRPRSRSCLPISLYIATIRY